MSRWLISLVTLADGGYAQDPPAAPGLFVPQASLPSSAVAGVPVPSIPVLWGVCRESPRS